VLPSVGDLVINSTLTDLGVGVVLDTWREQLGFGYVQVAWFKNNIDDTMWSPVEQVKIVSRGHDNENW
jgi:hypothetical protein